MKSGSVLCPIDFDEASFAALPLAAEQAQARDAFLDLLHVWQPGREYAPGGSPHPIRRRNPRTADQAGSGLPAESICRPSGCDFTSLVENLVKTSLTWQRASTVNSW